MKITLPADLWARIVFAAQESDDRKLKTLIEQAVASAQVEYTSSVYSVDLREPGSNDIHVWNRSRGAFRGE